VVVLHSHTIRRDAAAEETLELQFACIVTPASSDSGAIQRILLVRDCGRIVCSVYGNCRVVFFLSTESRH
jgi:hypothetical protein